MIGTRALGPAFGLALLASGCSPASDSGDRADSGAESDAAPAGEGDATGGDAATSDADSGPPACSPFVTNVVRVSYGAGAGFGQGAFPAVVEGPPKGAGCCRGSLDVLSLGEGGVIVVEFGEVIVDGPGVDFIVFENPFDIAMNPQNPNADPATVEVSADGVTWFGFPCTADAYPWQSCAGWHPVFADPRSNAIDPLDPAAAGGDPFDLADLATDGGLAEMRYLRITDRPDVAGDFDLDAVGIVHGRCR